MIDLMEALRASLEKKGPARAKPQAAAPAPQAATRKPPKQVQKAEPAARKKAKA